MASWPSSNMHEHTHTDTHSTYETQNLVQCMWVGHVVGLWRHTSCLAHLCIKEAGIVFFPKVLCAIGRPRGGATRYVVELYIVYTYVHTYTNTYVCTYCTFIRMYIYTKTAYCMLSVWTHTSNQHRQQYHTHSEEFKQVQDQGTGLSHSV